MTRPDRRRKGVTTPDNQQVMTELAALRALQGLSQEAVAARLGIDRRVVSNWEKCLHNPTHTSVVRYAAALGYRLELVPIDDDTTEETT